MSSFFAALVAYFACDGIATERLLTQDEAQKCVRSYQAVKAAFLSEEERADLSGGPTAQTAALRKGYLRFCDWKMRNPEQVRQLRLMSRQWDMG